MDGVRLTAPTVLNVSAEVHSHDASQRTSIPPPVGGPPSAVLLVVAHGGHKIAFHHPPSETSNICGFDPQVLADLLLTNSALFEQLFDLTVGEARLIGWPLSLQSVAPVLQAVVPEKESALASGMKLRALNVVFVLGARPSIGEEAKYDKVLAACQSVVKPLAYALQREEASNGLVSRHVALGAVTMPGQKDERGSTAAAAAGSAAGCSGAGPSGAVAGAEPSSSAQGGVGGQTSSAGVAEASPAGDEQLQSQTSAPAAPPAAAAPQEHEQLPRPAASGTGGPVPPVDEMPSAAGDGRVPSAASGSEVGSLLVAALHALQEARPIKPGAGGKPSQSKLVLGAPSGKPSEASGNARAASRPASRHLSTNFDQF